MRAVERVAHQPELFIRTVGSRRVDRAERGVEAVQHAEPRARLDRAEIGAGGGALRHGAQPFEQAGMGEARVAGEQALDPRGARSHRSQHHDRGGDRPVQNLGPCAPQRLRAQPRPQRPDDLAVRERPADRVECRLPRERGDQDVKGLAPVIVSEILETLRPRGKAQQPIRIQRGFG
jgi:hypothetical protein